MKDQTETPPTDRKAARRGVIVEPGVPPMVATEADAPAVADLETEVANLRLLIRRQDAVVERLLIKRAGTDASSVTANETAQTTKRAKRSTRRGLLTQLAAGAAGVAAAAVYGTTKAGTASADFYGTNVGPSSPQAGILAYPPGVTPITNVQTSQTAGVWGQRDNSAPDPGHDAGVIGISNLYAGVLGRSNSYHGVYGTTPANSAAGVFGQGLSANSPGVWGSNAVGIGVQGSSSIGPGVKGLSSDAPGVLGVSVNQPGIDGTSTNSLGIRGTSTNFVGLLGLSTNNHGLYGSTHGANAYGIVAENTGGGPGLYVFGSAFINGSLLVSGAKNAIIKMQDGTTASVYCQESPEPYFEDFGRGQLVGGVANVPIEREFAALVAGGDYMVFTHPEGDTRGLFVSRRNAAGFEVREVQGGTGNVPFTYRIVTKRKDIEGKRFARVSSEAADKVAGVRAVLASMGTPGSTPPTQQPGAPAPTPGFTVSPGLTVQQPGAAPSAVPHP